MAYTVERSRRNSKGFGKVATSDDDEQSGPVLPMTPGTAKPAPQAQSQPANMLPAGARTGPAAPPMLPTMNQAQMNNIANRTAMNTRALANPNTAMLPHVKAAVNARNLMNDMQAQRGGLGENYTLNRHLVGEANARANATTGAQNALTGAQTNELNTMTPVRAANLGAQTGQIAQATTRDQTMLPIDARQGTAKAAGMEQDVIGQRTMQPLEADAARAETAGKQAIAGKITAEAGQIAAGDSDLRKRHDLVAKDNENLRKELSDLRAVLARYQGVKPASSGALDAVEAEEAKDAAAKGGSAPQQPGQTQASGGNRLANAAQGATVKRGQQNESGPVRVSSQADIDALPSGTIFIGPDGKQRKKP